MKMKIMSSIYCSSSLVNSSLLLGLSETICSLKFKNLKSHRIIIVVSHPVSSHQVFNFISPEGNATFGGLRKERIQAFTFMFSPEAHLDGGKQSMS